MHDPLLTFFVAVTAIAVVIQMGILAALFLAVRKTSARMESLAGEVQRRAMPVLDTTQAVVLSSRPKVETIIENLTVTTSTIRAQLERLDGTVTELLERTRVHVARADELVTRTLDRVEQTRDVVHTTVTSPVRHLAGVVQGLTAGLEVFFGGSRKNRRNGGGNGARS